MGVRDLFSITDFQGGICIKRPLGLGQLLGNCLAFSFGGRIMADLQGVIDETRPMLEEFLSEIGLHRAGTRLSLPRLLEPFSRWVDALMLRT